MASAGDDLFAAQQKADGLVRLGSGIGAHYRVVRPDRGFGQSTPMPRDYNGRSIG